MVNCKLSTSLMKWVLASFSQNKKNKKIATTTQILFMYYIRSSLNGVIVYRLNESRNNKKFINIEFMSSILSYSPTYLFISILGKIKVII